MSEECKHNSVRGVFPGDPHLVCLTCGKELTEEEWKETEEEK